MCSMQIWASIVYEKQCLQDGHLVAKIMASDYAIYIIAKSCAHKASSGRQSERVQTYQAHPACALSARARGGGGPREQAKNWPGHLV